MRLIWTAIAGMLTAIILWYFINAWIGDAGIRFIRGQGWPVSTAWLAAAIGAVVGLIQELRGRRNQKIQTAAAEWTGAELGLEYTPTVEQPDTSLRCFANWSSGKDGNVGVIDGVPVSVFDMTSLIDSDEGSSYRAETVVLLPAAGLPKFTVNPRGFGGWLARAFGLGGLTFDPDTAGNDADVVRHFARTLRVELPGDRVPFEPVTDDDKANEAGVRKLFTTNLMSALLRYPDLSYEANGEWLAFFRRSVLLPAGERPQLLAAAREIRAALLAVAADSSRTGIAALTLPTPGQYLSRWLGTLAGALLGLGGGFFGGGGAALAWGFWMIVPFLAAAVGLVIGGTLGYFAGLAIGQRPAVARWKSNPPGTPEQQAQKHRRSKWQIGCGCFGWFMGFIAGSAIFMLLDAALGNPQMQAWNIVLFFGSPLIGMIVGILVFAWIGGHIADRRKESKC
jgi:hypothetical protein